MRGVAALVGLLAVSGAASLAAAQSPPTDFLFSEDNQVANSPGSWAEAVGSSAAIKDDQWLNAPLTRLDYVLINVEAHLNKFLPAATEELARDYFEKFLGTAPPSVDLAARYLSSKGRMIIGASIDTLGKPKKPMKEFCAKVLRSIEMNYPLDPVGYSWQNNALGLLVRDADVTAYDQVVQNLARSSIISVSVAAMYKPNDHAMLFHMTCLKKSADAAIKYYKSSLALRDPP